ncbi:MAG: hydrogenase expression/formation protein HypE [Phycisphaerae bacterium]|nr:hydrogenase expression/formation protein HypE [Phycisphaerae bacterium]
MASAKPSPGTIERVVLAHGGGGELTGRLIRDHLLPALANDALAPLTDGAVLPWDTGELVFTTDSYVVTPLEFPGGDIGTIAVAGTVNDLSVMGATPVALSLGLIIEEGLPIEVLDRIVGSISATARESGVEIVTGDTKVIERRGGDGLFINTAGVGRLRHGVKLDVGRVEPGDVIIINGRVADHGLTIMSVRSGIEFESELRSDARPLNRLIGRVLDSGVDVKFIRDATRGGLAGVLADISEHRGLTIEIDEDCIPISPTARHAAEMLGLDPITVANEGKIVCVVAAQDAAAALSTMRSEPEGRSAAVIGRVTAADPPLVELNTSAGGQRIIQRPYGEELPRIC